MRLFGRIGDAISRFDRAEWMTPIFDLAFWIQVVPSRRTIVVLSESRATSVLSESRLTTVASEDRIEKVLA